jgi:lysophospholipase L1-like esterase
MIFGTGKKMTKALKIIWKAVFQIASNFRLRRPAVLSTSMQMTWAFGLAIAIPALAASSTPVQAQHHPSPAEICLAANPNISIGVRLPRTGTQLTSGARLKVVAIGSSSTVGLWVLNSAATYPAVMRQELIRLRPDAQIEVINSGRVGDTIPDSIARIERDVLSHRPDLIIWQLGTNDIAWGGQAGSLDELMTRGIRTLKSQGSDVILMDQQYARQVLSSSGHSQMQAMIANVARKEHIGMFSRFDLMRNSVRAGLSTSALVSWDGLHNSKEGYDCIGRAIARAIWSAAR